MAERYSADEVAKTVSAGDSNTAGRQLNADYLNMSPTDFRAMVDQMNKISAADTASNHHAIVEKDTAGDIKSIYVTNEIPLVGNVWSSKAFDKDDYKATVNNTLNPAENFSRLSRVIGGATDQK